MTRYLQQSKQNPPPCRSTQKTFCRFTTIGIRRRCCLRTNFAETGPPLPFHSGGTAGIIRCPKGPRQGWIRRMQRGGILLPNLLRRRDGFGLVDGFVVRTHGRRPALSTCRDNLLIFLDHSRAGSTTIFATATTQRIRAGLPHHQSLVVMMLARVMQRSVILGYRSSIPALSFPLGLHLAPRYHHRTRRKEQRIVLPGSTRCSGSWCRHHSLICLNIIALRVFLLPTFLLLHLAPRHHDRARAVKVQF